jgi:hypothetical protein
MAERTRQAQSSIDLLPEDIKSRLQELLRDPRVTQLAATAKINEILAAEGHPDRLSKSSVNRYDLQMREAGARLRQSREVAGMWIGKLGAAPQGQVGNLVNEILRTLAFDLSLKLQETDLTADSIPEVIEMLRGLSLSAMRLEKAASENVKREEEIRKQALTKAAERVAGTGKKLGITQETIDTIRKDILGF